MSRLPRKLPPPIPRGSAAAVRPSRGKSVVAASALAALLVAAALTARAPTATAAPTIPTVGATLQAKRARAAKIQAQLDKMRKNLSAKMAEYAKISRDLDETRKQIVVATNQLEQIQAQLASDQTQLNDLAVRSYKTDGLDALSVMLGTTSFDDFLTRIDFLGMIGKHDAEIVTQVQAVRDEAQRVQTSLQERDARLIGLRNLADAERAAIQSGIVSEQTLLDSLGADIQKLLKELEQLRIAAMKGLRWETQDGASWIAAGSLLPGAYGTLDGRPGERYLIPKNVPTAYAGTGSTIDGLASWYGNAENGAGTSSGRPYNQEELTCANKELPLGTLLAVSANGKHVIVLITDHGPYIAGRSIDLSHAAAVALGVDGVGQVHAEVVQAK